MAHATTAHEMLPLSKTQCCTVPTVRIIVLFVTLSALR